MRNDFETNYLAHHGILGMKWGIRRYQNPDGSLTSAGRARYGVADGGSVNDISSSKGYNRRMKDLKKAIKKNEKARGKQYTKIANNPENFLGMNKKHAKKIEEHSENIRKGEAEIERLKKKADDANKQTDGAAIDARAHAAAKAAGLDQGDNWKVYRDAQAGDKKAKAIIKEWESGKKSTSESDNKVKETASKAHTWVGDADETFSFLAKNSYDNITGYGNRVGDVKNAKNYDKTEMKEVFRDAFGGDNAAQRKALKMLYAAEVSRYMDEESSDPGSSQVFRNVKADDTVNRFSDLLVGDSWGSDSANEWKSYMEDNIGHEIKALTSQEKADALKETGLYYTEEDLENIRKHG